MKVDVPGRGAVDISRVAVVGPVWTSLDTYREACEYLCEDCWNAAVGQSVLGELRALRDRIDEQNDELRALRKKWHRALGKLDDRERELREAKARAKDLEEQVEYLERAREIQPPLALSLARGGIENTLRADAERAQALLKLTECEMWLGRCTAKGEEE